MAFMGQRLIEFGKQGVLVAAVEIFDGFEYFGFYQRNAYLQRSPYSTSLALGKDSLAIVSFFKTLNYYLYNSKYKRLNIMSQNFVNIQGLKYCHHLF